VFTSLKNKILPLVANLQADGGWGPQFENR